MKALILVGGKGTRLKPYTTVLPKPLLPVGDRPILEIILHQLKFYGFDEVILAVGHMSHLFESFFQDGSKYGIAITYSFEDKPLGTAGAIASSINDLDEDFLILNGDLLTTLNFRDFFNFHIYKNASGTIATYNRKVQLDFGVIESDEEGKLISLEEKPSFNYNFGMGVNVLNKSSIIPLLEKNVFLDMPDLMLKMKDKDLPVFSYTEDCFWLDMGRPADYDQANEVFNDRKAEFLP